MTQIKQLLSNNYYIIAVVLSIFIGVSCSTGNNVVQNGFLQKRKYNKGQYFSLKKKNAKTTLERKKNAAKKLTAKKKAEEISLQKKSVYIPSVEPVFVADHKTEEVKEEGFSIKTNEDKQVGHVLKEEYNTTFLSPVKEEADDKINSEFVFLGGLILAFSILTLSLLSFAFIPIFALGGLVLMAGLNEQIFYKTNKRNKRLSEEEKRTGSTIFLIGGLISALGYSLFMKAVLFTAFSPFLAIGGVLFGVGITLMLIALNYRTSKYRKKIIEEIKEEESEPQDGEIPMGESAQKSLKTELNLDREVAKSKRYTGLSIILPFFIFPAYFHNIRVMKLTKGAEDEELKRLRSGALGRMIILPMLVVVGLTIILSILATILFL